VPVDCPASLRRVLDRCLAPRPDDRWQTPEELAQQLAVCLDPEARELVDPPEHRPDTWRWKYAIPLLLLMMLVPSALAGLYNYIYNVAVLRELPIPGLMDDFHTLVGFINATAFPAGIAVGIWLATRVVTTVKAVQALGCHPEHDSIAMRRSCLRLGEHAAILSLTLWFISGLVYPTLLKLWHPAMPNAIFGLFIGSLTMCGLIASAYPFFLVTYSAVHGLYPVFVQCGAFDQRDAMELHRLGNRLKLYFTGAALVPLLAVFGLVVAAISGTPTVAKPSASSPAVSASDSTTPEAAAIPADQNPGAGESGIRKVLYTLVVVCLGGLAAGGVTYVYYRKLETHLAALERVVAGRVGA
jgi:hypothetical protein